MNFIEVKHLIKEFKSAQSSKRGIRDKLLNVQETKRAVDGIDFSIQQGEIVGYIGPNGAGKSTTIKILTGILVPTSGEVIVNGLVPYKSRKQHASNIGVVFGQRTQLWWELPVADSLNLLKHIYKVPDPIFRKNLELYHDILSIGEFIHKPVRQLSLGQRMRADFAASLLHNPNILFLDEPTIGLDIVVKEKIRHFIKTINEERGVTVILTTHDMGDIERLCKRTIVIDKGKKIYDGNVQEMKTHFGKRRILVMELSESFKGIEMNGVTLEQEEGLTVTLSFDKELVSPAQIIAEFMKNYEIRDLTIQEPQIQDIVKLIYEGQYSESPMFEK
ncbi:ABC transporter ATP-binding protein [Paenibacillus lutimineralis]|uniref:ABC transporter ATP-binding protein n=1 Tax=Paenibacillus lutimineralis TaxID=2707005 RepID=A0A3Q9IA31_9BACL|nr:ATP-binding cassette domain-containing protein [Paenibacillus lutimineralis]AZS16346.1 ABC transporter ATP-binding protein [Paenibacillus lutimineralis]